MTEFFEEVQTITETPEPSTTIEIYAGARGPKGPDWHSGGFPIPEGIGVLDDMYLVTTGTTNLGNVYEKTSSTGWTLSGNIRGPQGAINTVNGKTGSSVIITASDITSGVLPFAQIPVGTTATTVAAGNHNHDSSYEAIIPVGTSAQYYRGDKTWQPLTKATVGLSNVDNTSDANKPISTATQTALNAKANTASPTFTGTVTAPAFSGGGAGITGLTKAQVGLSNVDNTSDAAKPISTAVQTALNGKVNLTGNETIQGTKTFGAAIIAPSFIGSGAALTGLTKTQVGLSNVDNTSDNAKPVSSAQLNAILGRVPYEDFLQYGNPFGGKRIYITELHNLLFKADARWTVTAKRYRKSDDVLMSTASPTEVASLFNGDYEGMFQIPLGQYVVINITFPTVMPGYPYGNFYISHYHSYTSESQSARFYYTYAAQGGPGWHTLPKSVQSDGAAAQITKFANDKYDVQQMEFRVDAPDTGTMPYTAITQIEMQPQRPSTQERPFVDKYRANSLYDTLTWKNAGTTTVTINTAGYVSAVAFNGNGGALTGLTKGQVGLNNVDNTSDVAKPISTATQNALNLKANIASPTFTGTVTAPSFAGSGSALTGLTKTQVGLSNVDNTSDVNKPVSTATTNALRSKSDDPSSKLAALYAALARRNVSPAKIAFLGDSHTYGLSATADKFRWVDQFIHGLQTGYKSAIPGHFPRVQTLGEAVAAPPVLPGVAGINAGFGGATSATYCTSSHIYSLGLVSPDAYVHAVGFNDSVDNPTYAVTPAQYEINVNKAINDIDAMYTTGKTTCHILVNTFRPWNVSEAHWMNYGNVLRKIADARDNVFYVDASDMYKMNKAQSPDPRDLIGVDATHMSDAGHALMADTVMRKTGLSSSLSGDDGMLFMSDTFTSKNTTTPTGPEVPTNRPWAIQSGTWEIRDRTLICLTQGVILTDSGMSDLDISSVFNTADTGLSLNGMMWRASAANNGYGTFVNIASSKLQVYRFIAPASTTVVAEASYSFALNKKYWVRTIVKGNRVLNYVNGELVLEYATPSSDTLASNTMVGYWSNGDGTAYSGFAVRRV